MGALAALLAMTIIFCTSLFFISISIIILIIRKTQMKKGQLTKKRWLIIPLIILVMNIFLISIPLAFTGFLREANGQVIKDKVYAESGEMLYWPMDNYDTADEWFMKDDIKYVDVSTADNFLIELDEDMIGEPVANITYKSSHLDFMNTIVSYIFAGCSPEEYSMSTLYQIKTRSSYEFLSLGPETYGTLYCQKNEFDKLNSYYSNISNYDSQNIFEVDYVENTYQTWEKTEKKITLEPGVFEKLDNPLEFEQDFEHIKIPIDNLADNSDNINVKEINLISYSRDKLAQKSVYLVLIDDQVYISQQKFENEYVDRYLLPPYMNEYIKKTVFSN